MLSIVNSNSNICTNLIDVNSNTPNFKNYEITTAKLQDLKSRIPKRVFAAHMTKLLNRRAYFGSFEKNRALTEKEIITILSFFEDSPELSP